MHNVFIIIAIGFFINTTYAIENLYRADLRTPEEITRSGGLMSRGVDNAYDFPMQQIDINLFSHAVGTPHGNTRYDDGYVSTTTSLNQAHNIGQNILSGSYQFYIYVVHPAPNLIDVNGVLHEYSPHSSENEYAALGYIPLSQIVGWYVVTSGVRSVTMTRNRQYEADLYDGLDVAPPGNSYQLAGFPEGHQAWQEEPWRSAIHSNAACTGSTRRPRREADPNSMSLSGIMQEEETCEELTNDLSRDALAIFLANQRSNIVAVINTFFFYNNRKRIIHDEL